MKKKKPKPINDRSLLIDALYEALNALEEAKVVIKLQNHDNCLASVLDAIEYVRETLEDG